jgi:hypothetical protein
MKFVAVIFAVLGPGLYWLVIHHGCKIGVHDWRNGPGAPCALCGERDDLWE